MNSSEGEVTRLVRLLGSGREDVRPRLFELVYNELRHVAGNRMRSEAPEHTLTPTALVHEAYLRLGGAAGIEFADRAHFFAVVAQAMRRILVDHARAKRAARRNGAPPELLDWAIAAPETDDRILAVDEALDRLAEFSPRQSRVVELRYFAGLTEDQVASVLGVTRRTVCRDWQMARSWLYRTLNERGEDDTGTVAQS